MKRIIFLILFLILLVVSISCYREEIKEIAEGTAEEAKDKITEEPKDISETEPEKEMNGFDQYVPEHKKETVIGCYFKKDSVETQTGAFTNYVLIFYDKMDNQVMNFSYRNKYTFEKYMNDDNMGLCVYSDGTHEFVRKKE